MIVRNPLDAYISEFNRDQFIKKYQGNTNSLTYAYLPLQTFDEKNFKQFFFEFKNKWKMFHNEVLKHFAKTNCHIVFYEDLKSNLINEMIEILNEKH